MARPFFTWLATIAALLPLAFRSNAAGTFSYNGLALTPAMGWDNWNAFGCMVSEELILNTAQKIVEFGLRDLGRNPAACDGAKRRMLMPVCRLLLHHPRRLLVQRQDLKRYSPSECYQIPRWNPSGCGKDSQHGAWVGDVFLCRKIYLRAIWYGIVVRILIIAMTKTEIQQLHLWEWRNKTPKHSPIGGSITSSTTIATMRDRKGRLLSRTIDTRQCRMRSMLQVMFQDMVSSIG